MLFAGTISQYQGPLSGGFETILPHLMPALGQGLAFAVSLLAILLAHEFGHYLAGRYHRTAVTLPYFIPFPFSPFGTMGAFIQLKEPPRNKRILLDIGAAGPLAGLFVAIPILFLGLYLSEISQLPVVLRPGEGFSLEGNSILYLLAKYIVFGEWLPRPINYAGLDPVLYWIRYFFTGQPVPLGGTDVLLHPVAWAGWAGLLVTALNLIPAGQLDGGHLLHVLLGSRARAVLPFILVALIALGTVWSGWWLWAFLIFMLGRVYAEPLDQITPLDPSRQAVAILGLVIFFLVFTPIPLSLFGA
jgi:membrane-associated protease RseP (regulator of RpoE activity)